MAKTNQNNTVEETEFCFPLSEIVSIVKLLLAEGVTVSYITITTTTEEITQEVCIKLVEDDSEDALDALSELDRYQ